MTVLVTSHIALDKELMYLVIDRPLILKINSENTSRMAVNNKG